MIEKSATQKQKKFLPKKNYHRPKLTVLSSIAELTQDNKQSEALDNNFQGSNSNS